MRDCETDRLTLEGAQQDWAVAINPDADWRQRQICMQRLAAVDIQSNGRIVTPMVCSALDALEGELLEQVTGLMMACFARTMMDVFDQLGGRGG